MKANVIAAAAKISRNGEVAALQEAYGEVRTDRPSQSQTEQQEESWLALRPEPR